MTNESREILGIINGLTDPDEAKLLLAACGYDVRIRSVYMSQRSFAEKWVVKLNDDDVFYEDGTARVIDVVNYLDIDRRLRGFDKRGNSRT